MERAWKTRVMSIVQNSGKFLVLHISDKDLDFWEFPSGTMEFGETPEQTAAREVKEETGLSIEPNGLFGVNSCNYEHMGKHVQENVIAYLFQADDFSVDISRNQDKEHDEYRWVTFDELKRLPKLAATLSCFMDEIQRRLVDA